MGIFWFQYCEFCSLLYKLYKIIFHGTRSKLQKEKQKCNIRMVLRDIVFAKEG